MFSRLILRRWFLGVAPFSLILCSLIAHAQVTASTHRANSVQPPFSVLDESVATMADSLLAFDPRITPQTQPLPGREAPKQNQASAAGKLGFALSPATARLEFLRPTVDPILRSQDVPPEMAAIILVESGGRATAMSPKGARGLWQLMPATARRYGLVVNETTDERLDVERSTRAAAQYLRDLYRQFGSWPLALAAYNAGERGIQRALDRSGASEFGTLSAMHAIPLETSNYVPAVMAAARSLGLNISIGQIPPQPVAWTVFAYSHD